MADSKELRRYRLDTKELKSALHEGVLASFRGRGESVNPRGYVHAEVTYDSETDRVIGAVVWYTRKPLADEEMKDMVRV